MILDEEIKSFLMDNAEDMQKVLIQEIRDKFIEKVDDKIVWKQGFRVRMQEIEEVENRYNEAIKEVRDNLRAEFCDCTNEDLLMWECCVGCKDIDRIFKDKFALSELSEVKNE